MKPNYFFSDKKFLISQFVKDKSKFAILPTIFWLKNKDYGIQTQIYGFVFAFAFWQWEIGIGIIQQEMFVQPINYSIFTQWFSSTYKKEMTQNMVEEFLERNKEMKIFVERTSLSYHYPRVILGRAINKSLK